MSESLLVASGKGGVGKTIFTVNLGAVLARTGARTVLLDMNMGLRNLDICLGLENSVIYDIGDALGETCALGQALIRDKRFPYMYLIAAAQSKEKSHFTARQMESLCEKLKKTFDYIIIDAPDGLDEGLALAAAGADRAVIITTQEYSSIRDADMTDQVLQSLGVQKRSVVVNKLKEDLVESGLVPSIAEISESLRPPIVGMIPYDDNIHVAANNGLPLALAQDNYICKNFANIAERIFD